MEEVSHCKAYLQTYLRLFAVVNKDEEALNIMEEKPEKSFFGYVSMLRREAEKHNNRPPPYPTSPLSLRNVLAATLVGNTLTLSLNESNVTAHTLSQGLSAVFSLLRYPPPFFPLPPPLNLRSKLDELLPLRVDLDVNVEVQASTKALHDYTSGPPLEEVCLDRIVALIKKEDLPTQEETVEINSYLDTITE